MMAVNMNYVSPEMKRALAPTDTRLRGDERYWEEGKEAEAGDEKVRLEVKQRKARKIR